ncbi:hypothetical protein PCG10_008126 [Penicillium crustosum]|uniref:Uncharacterized protein n=1 Tax=Penicillium crustosum TaxID=36656 RepID=A0A9P5GLP7_PENCR|nr:hypothetical protein PCG10_008126 [Penicillium crustosum]
MSTTTSTTSSVSATSTACGGSVWEIPTTDAACAAVISGNITDVMDDCCKDAKVSKYDNDCGIYCLAQGQDVNKLQSCLTSKSGNYHDVFCNAALNATATATATGSKSTSSGTGTSTQSSTTSTSTNAAIANQPVSKSGVGLIALLFGSALMAGFEAIKQLLQQTQPYSFILGVRDTEKTRIAYDALKFDTSKHSVSVLPLDLLDLKSVQSFAKQALSELGQRPLDYLFLIAGLVASADGPGPHGSQWCESYVVNHLAQHYLTHHFAETLSASQSRVVIVSSGAIRGVRGSDPRTLDVDLKAKSGANAKVVYSASKFTQLLGAHYWRRSLPNCKVVAVSPGLIPNTKLAQHSSLGLSMDMPDAKTVPEGAQNILRAVTVDNLPADPEQIFLTSWGEWWPKDVYALSLDPALQDKWCLSKEDIEKSEPVFKE